MAGITRYEAERRIKQVFEEYVGALKTAAYKKEYLKAEALSLFSGLETFETFTKTKELTELYSALNTEGIRELFRISMALAYLYRLPSYKKYKDSVIEYQKLYKIKADSREYIGEERNMEVEQGRTIRFRLEQVNDYLRSGGSEIYYTVEWKKKDKTGNDKSGWVNNRVKDSFDDNPYDRDFKFNESGNYIIEADVVERLCMRQEYRKVVEHNELEVIVVPGDERIRAMPFSEKLKIALEYADWEGAAYKARDMAVLFAACSAVLGVLVLTPLDEVIIVLAPVLELIGYGGSAIEFAKAVYKLADFVERVRNAQSEGALAEAGSIFAEAAAAIGITILFAFLGRLSKMTKERFRNRKQVTVNSTERYGHSSVKAYKTEAQITEYIKNLKVDSGQQTKLMTELAHDPKNLKRFLNRYGDEAASLIKRHGYPPKYWKGRPSYKEGQVETVWENAKDDTEKIFFKKDGIEYIRDKNGTVSWNKDIPRKGQWDMGHLEDQKYSDMYDRFLRGKMSEQEFLEWYRTAENYEPQTIPFNRGHKGE